MKNVVDPSTAEVPTQLQDAVARLARNKQLINELSDLLRDYEKCVFERYLPAFDESRAEYVVELPDPTSFPPPASIKILVGDIVDNLRKSLDYLVFQIAKHNEGKEVGNTQFVISGSAHQFDRAKKSGLKGLKEHQIRIIEEYQPYNGGEWLALLAKMSNQDKHRELHGVFNRDGLEMRFNTSNETEDYPDFAVFKNVDNHGANVCIKSNEPVVRLEDGRPALATLLVLHQGVFQVIERFANDFENGED